MRKYLAIFVLCWVNYVAAQPFVEAEMRGQLGNNLFIIATAYALARDHGADLYFPDLGTRYRFNSYDAQVNVSHLLYRCNLSKPPRPAAFSWSEPTFAYHPIPYRADMKIRGYFQSEKYFGHYREEILKLFAPLPEDLDYIRAKYGKLLEHPLLVGVQLRQNWEEPNGRMYNQYGKDYLRKAMTLFPAEALFVLSCNNLKFAKENVPEEMAARVVFLENELHTIDFVLLTLCKHIIITNSTFGWWAAWLNQHPDKIVVAPKQWMNPLCNIDTRDVVPESWRRVEAKWGPLNDPKSYQ